MGRLLGLRSWGTLEDQAGPSSVGGAADRSRTGMHPPGTHCHTPGPPWGGSSQQGAPGKCRGIAQSAPGVKGTGDCGCSGPGRSLRLVSKSCSPAEAQVESCSGHSELLIHGGRQGRGRGGPLGILLPWTWVPELGRSWRGLCPPGASGPGCGQTRGRTMPHLGVRGALRGQVGPSFTPGGQVWRERGGSGQAQDGQEGVSWVEGGQQGAGCAWGPKGDLHHHPLWRRGAVVTRRGVGDAA